MIPVLETPFEIGQFTRQEEEIKRGDDPQEGIAGKEIDIGLHE